jgi:hypothetical protein
LVQLKEDGSIDQELSLTVSNPSTQTIETTLLPNSGNSRIWFSPSHLHANIPPGGTATLTFHIARTASFHPAPFDPPTVVEKTAMHLQDRLIALPQREHGIRLQISRFPADASLTSQSVLNLSGGGSCVRVGNEQFSLPSGAMTIEGWVYPRQLDGRRPFLAKTESSEWGLFLDGGDVDFMIHLDGKYHHVTSSPKLLKTYRWYHIAGVYDGAFMSLYIDGKRVANAKASGLRKPNQLPFFIGADPNKSGQPVDSLDGCIDSVRLSSCARYSQEEFEPSREQVADSSTVLLFDFEQEYANVIRELGTQGAHGCRIGKALTIPLDRVPSR